MYNFHGFTQKANIAVNLGIEIAQVDRSQPRAPAEHGMQVLGL